MKMSYPKTLGRRNPVKVAKMELGVVEERATAGDGEAAMAVNCVLFRCNEQRSHRIVSLEVDVRVARVCG